MILCIYSFVINFIYLLIYPYARFKASRGDLLFQGRLGLAKETSLSDIWLHAASVGEVRVVGYLIQYLLKQNQKLKIHLTTMTRTGYKTACDLYGGSITVSYFPFDKKSALIRTFDYIKPKLLVIAETEIWPNLINTASQRKIPVILINGRMSEKAFEKYKIIKKSIASLLEKYERIYVKSGDDFTRYAYFSKHFEPSLVLGGDMKFDAPLVDRDRATVENTRGELGIAPGSFVFTAGSTRPGEEEILAEVYLELKPKYPSLFFILAPRHIERSEEIKTLLAEKNISFKIYGEEDENSGFMLVDKLGLLNSLYLASDLSFVGGTLADIGGHNILEPVWAGCPVIYGPSIHNVLEASQYVLSNNFGKQVADKDELEETIEKTINGNTHFKRKSSHDLDNSATFKAGEYILQKLKDI